MFNLGVWQLRVTANGITRDADKKSTMVFDDTLPNIDESIFQQNPDWSEYYRDAQEKIPLNAPEPRGKPVRM
jgi:hypothetical protein